MSKIKNVVCSIQEDLAEGYFSLLKIAEMHNVSLDFVESIDRDMVQQLETNEGDNYGETDDGYALASAGFGTDEDYGGFDDYNYDYE